LTRDGSVDDMIGPFADWHFDWLDVPGLIRSATQVLEYPMVDQNPCRTNDLGPCGRAISHPVNPVQQGPLLGWPLLPRRAA
jgi:hypothetical protein